MDTVTIDSILEKFPDLLSWHSGSKSATSNIPCSSAKPERGGLCFCQDQKDLENCFDQGVSIFVVTPSLGDYAKTLNPGGSAVLISDDPVEIKGDVEPRVITRRSAPDIDPLAEIQCCEFGPYTILANRLLRHVAG